MNREEGKRRQNPFLADGVNRNAANNGVTEKFHAVRGHGFAAERANHLYDSVLPGSSAELVGDNNAKDGADRIVGGIQIQSKYCASGAKCVRECFRDGKFRYYADGKPMQIEVPSDLYEDAVRAMESRIEKGEVAGISDPKQARSIIRRGHITYAQARNIAKAGTIESLTYDATTGAISALPGASVTGVVSFWNACESGCAPKEAVLIAAKSVGGVVGKNAAINLAASQATKLGLNAALRPAAKTVVEAVGFKGASLLATAANGGSKVLTGVAAQSAATKFLTSNAVTGAATTVILSASDLVDVFRGRMSTGEFAKNLTHTVGGVAGGVVGAAAALPCYWLYLEIGYRLLEKTHEEHPYNAWISVYGGEEFAADVRRCVAVVEEAFEQASPNQRVAAAQAYMSACLYERDFFDQAHRALR